MFSGLGVEPSSAPNVSADCPGSVDAAVVEVAAGVGVTSGCGSEAGGALGSVVASGAGVALAVDSLEVGGPGSTSADDPELVAFEDVVEVESVERGASVVVSDPGAAEIETDSVVGVGGGPSAATDGTITKLRTSAVSRQVDAFVSILVNCRISLSRRCTEM